MKQGLIRLLPKPSKENCYIENCRTITLINSDYKLLTSLFSKRLKPCLEDIISITRHIYNNMYILYRYDGLF